MSDDAQVSGKNDFLLLGPMGSRNSFLSVYRTRIGHLITTGCFSGTIDEFESRLTKETCHNSYRIFVSAIREWIKQIPAMKN